MNPQQLAKIIEQYKEHFPIYAEHCLKIQTKDKQIIPLKLNKAQIVLWGIVKDQIDKGLPVRIIVLKARQLGLSTVIEAIIFWLVTLNKNTSALVVAHETEASQILFSKQDLFYKQLPDYVKPLQKFNSVRELFFANPDYNSKKLGLQSRVIVKTADNKDLGASFTLHGAHLSELALWEEKGLDIKARLVNLYNAIPNTPWTFLFIETTARGDGYFRSMWDDEESIYKKLFISWVADENYRMPLAYGETLVLDKKDNDPYGDEESEFIYIKEQIATWHQELTTESQITNEIYARLNWRRWCIKNNCEKDVILFQQEYPTIAQQAFSSTGSNVFNLQQLDKILNLATRKEHHFTYNNEVENRLKLNTNKSKKTLKTILTSAFISSSYIPNIKINNSFDLILYEAPIPGRKYVIGADVAEGYLNGDLSALVILKLPNLEEVGCFNKVVDPSVFGYILYCLGKLFNDALIGVESNDKGSVSTIRVLTDLLYNKLYQRELFSTTKHTHQQQVYGWKTSAFTKPMMISNLNNCIKSEEIKLNNYQTIKQLMKYKKLKDGSTGVPSPGHDDLAVACMIALQMAITIPEENLEVNRKVEYNTLAYLELEMAKRSKIRRLK